MKELRIVSTFLLLVFLISCSSEQGNRVVGDQLSVYFDLPENEKIAEEIAIYWKENGFLTGKKQDLKIILGENKNQLLLIENELFKEEKLTFKERKLLNDLKNDLQKKIFHTNLEIVVCDENFKPKYIIN